MISFSKTYIPWVGIGIVLGTLLFAFQTFAASSISYALSLAYDGTTLSHTDLRLISETTEARTLDASQNPFTVRLVSSDGTELYTSQFLFSFARVYQPPRPGGDGASLSKHVPAHTTIAIPYFPTAQSIDIYKKDIHLLSVDVSQYRQGEQGKEEKTDTIFSQLKTPSPFSPWTKILFGLIIIIVIGGVGFWFYRQQYSLHE